MDDAERAALIERLRDGMSDFWEATYCASWMNVPSEIEAVCRQVLTANAPLAYANAEITVERAQTLWAMAERLGGWILEKYESGETEVTLLPFTPLGAVRDPSKEWPAEGWSPDDL